LGLVLLGLRAQDYDPGGWSIPCPVRNRCKYGFRGVIGIQRRRRGGPGNDEVHNHRDDTL
jgi:hypothetical protein